MTRAKPWARVIIQQHTIITKLIIRPLRWFSWRFPKFKYVCFPSLKITLSIAGCHFLLERPSCFVSKSNSLTQFNLIREIVPYTDLTRFPHDFLTTFSLFPKSSSTTFSIVLCLL